jgi:putative membrane-bound dehydrogenase-like protein
MLLRDPEFSMNRFIVTVVLVAVGPASLLGQGLSPQEACKRMRLPNGFAVRCVASEPMIRQPVSISFDSRGRLWVLQYLQYPNYAGLKPIKQDQYLRTVWDRVPEPPPYGPKGLDRITILFDPDDHGVYRKSKDFVTGLNIASGFCLGNGGVYVMQPPYLLFYPDKNEDDIPDGDPEVLLTGFGMEDTHSLANSLQWGPDGWLYGAAGSTSTCKIKNPAQPNDPILEFQQGIWRFHPRIKKFELFSEGGGNTYGLDFDQNGQAIAGTNWGGFACLHQMQGAYYVKGFAKHGPLHNPHTYGYFDHVPYTGFQGGHVTCGGIVYQADTYPEQYRNQYIAANLLSNAVYWHKLEPVQASFRASHGGTLLDAQDPWFRPVDCLLGPDGCVYVVDFYDRRAAHLDPVDNWDKTNGRIYRIEYHGKLRESNHPIPQFDLRNKSNTELLDLLRHPNVWYRREARQLLAGRADPSLYSKLKKLAVGSGQTALEALWTLYVCGGADLDFLQRLYAHQDETIRMWAVRLTGDVAAPVGACSRGSTKHPAEDALALLALTEVSSRVQCQLACTARRLPVEVTLKIIGGLLQHALAVSEKLKPGETYDPGPHLPHLMWWALEERCSTSPNPEQTFTALNIPSPLFGFLTERIARRLMASDIPNGQKKLAHLLTSWGETARFQILQGIASATWTGSIHPDLLVELKKLHREKPEDELLLNLLARMGDKEAIAVYTKRLADEMQSEEIRLQAADLLRQLRPPGAVVLLLEQFSLAKSERLRIVLLAALEAFDDPAIVPAVFQHYLTASPAVKRRAVQMFLTRPSWALALFERLDQGTFPKAEVSMEQARAAVELGDRKLTALVEKHFGKFTTTTAGEKQARIAWLNIALGREKGNAQRGKAVFTKHCAACHQLHGEGGKVGPDLTTADRKNRQYLLTQIIDPSGYIRPEYVVQNVLTTDERKLLGIAREVDNSVELTNWVDNKLVTVLLSKSEIAELRPSAVSLMPENLLDRLSEAEIADLFAYLASDQPVKQEEANVPYPNHSSRLKVCLVSGSFEYKSDTSLNHFKKHLESSYPVDCTLLMAKNEKDSTLADIEQLLECDVAIFFTRRLQLEGKSLEIVKKFVKSGKPLIGVRTASHGFQKWLEMDKEVLGGDYRGHYGANIVCDVTIVNAAKAHPVLAGVKPFKSNGSLYKNPQLASDVTVLLNGTIPNHTEPVAWVREKNGQRIFYTSLGHPDDFQDANFIRLLVNALAWVTKTDF